MMLSYRRVLMGLLLAGRAVAQTDVGRPAFDHANAAGGSVVLGRYF